MSLSVSQPATDTVCARRFRKCPLGTCQPVRERGRAELMVFERPRLQATAASKVSVSMGPEGSGLWSSSWDARNGSEG